MLPVFQSCIICDAVREELRGKLTILGFMGVSPDVDVAVARIDQPVILCFVYLGSPGEGEFAVHFEIVDTADNRTVIRTATELFRADPNGPTMAVFSFPVLFGRPGHYAARLFMEGELGKHAEFQVSEDPARFAVPR